MKFFLLMNTHMVGCNTHMWGTGCEWVTGGLPVPIPIPTWVHPTHDNPYPSHSHLPSYSLGPCSCHLCLCSHSPAHTFPIELAYFFGPVLHNSSLCCGSFYIM